MTSKERFLTVFDGGIPDRLPVTTHHVMPYFLKKYMNGISNDEFFDFFGLDPIKWVNEHKPGNPGREYYDPDQGAIGFLEAQRISTDDWRIKPEILERNGYTVTRYNFITPAKKLSMSLRSNDQTSWVVEPLVKEKTDLDAVAKYMTHPHCNVEAVNRIADDYGERGLIRGHICCFDIFGQGGTWQDLACLCGTERLILFAHDDPAWVHAFLKVLFERKKEYIESLKGARFDLLELGGGAASTTVISPKIFDEFVAPYDAELIRLAHESGQRIVYHTCGGMMPILEQIADMNTDGMETFTPPGMGGDVVLRDAKQRIGDKVFMIGGFDQFHFFLNCPPEETREAVQKSFMDAGEGGGFILSPSDHFFDADMELIKAYGDEARKCTY